MQSAKSRLVQFLFAALIACSLGVFATACEKTELDPAPVGGTCDSIGGVPCVCPDGAQRCTDSRGKCLCDSDSDSGPQPEDVVPSESTEPQADRPEGADE